VKAKTQPLSQFIRKIVQGPIPVQVLVTIVARRRSVQLRTSLGAHRPRHARFMGVATCRQGSSGNSDQWADTRNDLRLSGPFSGERRIFGVERLITRISM
jgi:hypothetical protein